MHLNYHFFRFLCPALESTARGRTLGACFSQNKDELVMEFTSVTAPPFFIRALLLPATPCLSFPEDFRRSKKNNVDLFPELIGQTVRRVHLLSFERAFYVEFESGKLLLFKMHGSRSNILLFASLQEHPQRLFRKDLVEDLQVFVSDLEKPLSLDWDRFASLEGNASAFLPTLGKLPRTWLKEKGYLAASLESRFRLMRELLDLLESPLFSIYREEEQYRLTLLPCENPLDTTTDPIAAANLYYQKAVVRQAFEQQKNQLMRSLADQRKKTESYIQKTRDKLAAMEAEASPSQLADIIMANLHQIPAGSEKVALFDFYSNKTIEISLKRGQSPQKHAENLYRKSKNKKIEFEQVRQNLARKEALLSNLEQETAELASVQDFRSLKAFVKSEERTVDRTRSERLPFKRFEVLGYEVWVGKSARSNDELLRRYVWKDDLWLHAKDVAGSHVIIKNQSGKQLPAPVLERAASLAAYYSKSKTSGLAAVMYTPCKYVRKVKGSAPGAVMVDKEKVLMVPPEGPEER
ncbi:NFACT RNA binding domain-containing protein [Cyclobacterium xiamenense]|uniref:NFACT RNA binding domain-containing protein n=1 Tax=Cyclobacterium xiamenense TaxID=1297121 RepID=UPI0012B89E71|nr:NFACT RNA binding domain-containing protein [Cyclobacterium xiamenense]